MEGFMRCRKPRPLHHRARGSSRSPKALAPSGSACRSKRNPNVSTLLKPSLQPESLKANSTHAWGLLALGTGACQQSFGEGWVCLSQDTDPRFSRASALASYYHILRASTPQKTCPVLLGRFCHCVPEPAYASPPAETSLDREF